MIPPKTYIWMLIEVLLITTKIWKQIKCPSTGKWIHKQNKIKCKSPWNGYLAITGNEVLIHGTTNTSKNGAKWKKVITKDHILHYSIYMKCPEQANP